MAALSGILHLRHLVVSSKLSVADGPVQGSATLSSHRTIIEWDRGKEVWIECASQRNRPCLSAHPKGRIVES